MSLRKETLQSLCLLALSLLLCTLGFVKSYDSQGINSGVSPTVAVAHEKLETKADLIIKNVELIQEKNTFLVSDILQLSQELRDEIKEISRHCNNFTKATCANLFKDDPVDKPWWRKELSISMKSIRLQNALLIYTTLRPLFIVLGMISMIQYGIYGFRQAREGMLPMAKKIWAGIVHEITFCSSFDYMIDFCPKQEEVRTNENCSVKQ